MRAVAVVALLLASVGAELVRIQEAVEVCGWHKGPRVPADVELELIVALRNWNMQHLSDEVIAVSSPRSPRYGQHLRATEVADISSAGPEAQVAVRDWLRAAELPHRLSRWSDRVELRLTVRQIEALFATRIHTFDNGKQKTVQAGDLWAPAEVANSIGAVFGLHGTPLARAPARLSRASAAAVTPQLLREVHQVSGVEVKRGGKNSRATAEFQNQYTRQDDLTAFFKKYVPDARPEDSTYSCYPGHCEPEGREEPGTEAMLDIEYIMGPVPGIKTEVWTFSGMAWCTDLKNWTAHVLDRDDPPLVFSVSYGIQGNVSLDKRQGCSREIALNIEEDFVKIAARGITLIFSSGDDGSGGELLFKRKLWPVWPGSAPHVTSVGATRFVSGSSGEQRAVTSFGSGGGFSWRFPGQTWQHEAVGAYLANPKARLPSSADFAREGRATPELAALGEGYQVIAGGNTLSVGGTSASAPFFAGLVSLLNEYRLQQGHSPLGFLNPLIYDLASKGFTDITVGGNRVDRGSIPLREGYSCTEGWDAVTGWGTPRFQEILEYVKSLPSGRRQDEVVV